MRTQHARRFSRRRFLGGVTLAGTAGLLGLHPRPVAAEPPPETTRLRLMQAARHLCEAPIVRGRRAPAGARGSRRCNTSRSAAHRCSQATGRRRGRPRPQLHRGAILTRLDAGDPLVLLAGVHVGCFELFGRERVRTIRDLKGKTVAVPGSWEPAARLPRQHGRLRGPRPAARTSHWVTHPGRGHAALRGGQDRRLHGVPARAAGAAGEDRSATWWSTARSDRPWSQYFCCMVVAHREFVRQHPVATKRALRAILKATDLCALEPERRAPSSSWTRATRPRYDYALQTMQEIPYGQWREYDPEDTVRFYALRLHEAGMIKSEPAEDHRPGHRLALPQRAEEGAEGIEGEVARGAGG